MEIVGKTNQRGCRRRVGNQVNVRFDGRICNVLIRWNMVKVQPRHIISQPYDNTKCAPPMRKTIRSLIRIVSNFIVTKF